MEEGAGEAEGKVRQQVGPAVEQVWLATHQRGTLAVPEERAAIAVTGPGTSAWRWPRKTEERRLHKGDGWRHAGVSRRSVIRDEHV